MRVLTYTRKEAIKMVNASGMETGVFSFIFVVLVGLQALSRYRWQILSAKSTKRIDRFYRPEKEADLVAIY